MRILFDHQIFDAQKFGGISRYFFELISLLQSDKKLNVNLSLQYSNNAYLQQNSILGNNIKRKPQPIANRFFSDSDYFLGKEMLSKVAQKVTNKILPDKTSALNKAESIKQLKEGEFDIFHPTYYDDYFLEYLNGKPFVLTVYDLLYEVFPEFMMFYGDKSASLLSKANKIITISESTKKDLISIYGVDEKKVVVTYLANSLEVNRSINGSFIQKLPAQYLLFVGNRGGYKNFYFFVQVFKSLQKDYSDLHIMCTGPAFTEEEKRYFKNLGVGHQVHHLFVNDNELSILYTRAVAFIFPTQYEGFGLPILEAFACNCPVLCSKSSSLTEVAGESAIYFEPKNPASIKSALKLVLDNMSLRNELITKGTVQLQNFSWNITTEQTKQLYWEILQETK